MTDKPSREDVLRVEGEPAGYVRRYALEVLAKPGHTVINASQMADDDIKLYTEAQLLAMYAAGAEDMARYSQHLQAKIDSLMLEYCPDEMTTEQMAEYERNQRALPITHTNTEGEQG